jgi:hypothetical protein
MSLDKILPPIISKIDNHEPHKVLDGLTQLVKCLNDTAVSNTYFCIFY